MTLNELLRVFWRRKLLVVLVTAAAIGLAYGATRLLSPRYESTATVSISPRDLTNELLFFGSLDAVVPVYAEAATSRTTLDQARHATGGQLAAISVRTFKGTGLLKIKARSTDRRLALQSARAVTDALVERAENDGVGVASLRVSVIDRAALPTSPVFPRTRLTLVVAALLGLGIALGGAALRENVTAGIETADELARIAGVPVFGEIPAESRVSKTHSARELLDDRRLRVVAESLRELRTNLAFAGRGLRSLVVTSPDGSHGKTTVAFGLATTLAYAGTRTLLVDGDLRRGRLAEQLELGEGPGLIEVLLREADLDDAVRWTDLESLKVLPAGRVVDDPTEILAVELPPLLEALESRFEIVILDAPPIVPVSDARLIARCADAALLVVSARTPRRRVRTAIDRLALISVQPLAAVLNRSREVRRSRYYLPPRDLGAMQSKRREPPRIDRARGGADS